MARSYGRAWVEWRFRVWVVRVAGVCVVALVGAGHACDGCNAALALYTTTSSLAGFIRYLQPVYGRLGSGRGHGPLLRGDSFLNNLRDTDDA